MPLFIVLMMFCAFAGEREQGTLRQLLSLGVRPRDLALGKAAGIAAGLGLVLLPAPLGVTALALTADNGVPGKPRPRRIARRVFYLCLLRHRHCRVAGRVRTGALIAAGARGAADILVRKQPRRLAPWRRPRLVAVSDSIGRGVPDGNGGGPQRSEEIQQRLEGRKAELMRQYQVDSLDAVPVAFSGVSLQEGENHANDVFDRHYGRLFDTFERQNTVFQLGGSSPRCSPCARCRWDWRDRFPAAPPFHRRGGGLSAHDPAHDERRHRGSPLKNSALSRGA